jgi:hypothetical protein
MNVATIKLQNVANMVLLLIVYDTARLVVDGINVDVDIAVVVGNVKGVVAFVKLRVVDVDISCDKNVLVVLSTDVVFVVFV